MCKHTHTHAHPYSTFSDFISSHLSSYDPKKRGSLRDGERVVDALGVDLGALEPALVADRDVGDVEVAAGDSGGDEVVAGERERFFFLLGKVSFLPFFRFRASTITYKKKKKKKKKNSPASLVAVGRAGQQLVLVVVAARLVLGLLHVEERRRGDLVLGEPALGARRALEDLLAEQRAHDVVEELVGAAERADVGAGGLADDHVDVVDGVAVVLVREEHARGHDLAARVPLGGEEEREALAGVGDEAGGVGGLGSVGANCVFFGFGGKRGGGGVGGGARGWRAGSRNGEQWEWRAVGGR